MSDFLQLVTFCCSKLLFFSKLCCCWRLSKWKSCSSWRMRPPRLLPEVSKWRRKFCRLKMRVESKHNLSVFGKFACLNLFHLVNISEWVESDGSFRFLKTSGKTSWRSSCMRSPKYSRKSSKTWNLNMEDYQRDDVKWSPSLYM